MQHRLLIGIVGAASCVALVTLLVDASAAHQDWGVTDWVALLVGGMFLLAAPFAYARWLRRRTLWRGDA